MTDQTKEINEFEIETKMEEWGKSPNHDEEVKKFENIDTSDAQTF